MPETPDDYQIIDKYKSELHQLVINEAASNHRAFPDGEVDEVLVVFLYNKLTIAFPNRVVAPQVSPEFQVNFTKTIINLKRSMHDKEYGAWISMLLKIGVNNTHYFLFNYEDSIDYLIGTYDPEVYKDELKQWPRLNKNIPEWWRQKIETE